MCNENRGFLTTSLEMDKRRRPARSGLLQNVSQGRDRWGLAEGSTRQWPTVHLSDLGTEQIRQRLPAPDIKEAILRADRRPLQHTSPNQRESFDCSRHELVIDGLDFVLERTGVAPPIHGFRSALPSPKRQTVKHASRSWPKHHR